MLIRGRSVLGEEVVRLLDDCLSTGSVPPTILAELRSMFCVVGTSHKSDINERVQVDEELLHLRRDVLSLSRPIVPYLSVFRERPVHVKQSQHPMRHEIVCNKHRIASYQYTRRRKGFVYQEKLKFIVAGFGC